MNPAPRYELINLGDELLVGARTNTHLQFIADQLASRGIHLDKNKVVRDAPEEIHYAVKYSWENADVVILTGGMGALRKTDARKAVAEVLGLPLEKDTELEALIRKSREKSGNEVSERYLRQCYKLKGSNFLKNPYTYTPGIHFTKGSKHLFMLPGKPSELQAIFLNEVIPILEKHKLVDDAPAYLQLRSIGLDTESVARIVEPEVSKCAGLSVEYSKYEGIIDIQINTSQAGCPWEKIEAIGQACRKGLGDNFICFGQDTLEEVLFYQLRAMEAKFSVAESVTGGKIASGFTTMPEMQTVFAGGISCPDETSIVELLEVPEMLIEQHGLCSAEVAVAMAIACSEKYVSEYALSVTPFEPASSDNPVGSVFVGYASPRGAWAHKVMYPSQEIPATFRIKNAALDWIRRKLEQDKIQDYMATLDLESE